MQHELEKKADRFIKLKCQQAGIEVKEFEDMIQQSEQAKIKKSEVNNTTMGPEYEDNMDEDYLVQSNEQDQLIQKNTSQFIKTQTSVTDSEDVMTEFDDIRFAIEKHKQDELI